MRNRTPTRNLRLRPDLVQIKRQAKELLKTYRAGDAGAIAEVTAHYRGADRANFSLHDAQLVLARSYGFDSWPKLKAYVDGVTVKRLADAVRAGAVTQVRAMIKARPELVHMDMASDNEHRALHYAVLNRSPEMVRVLMEHGADARKGIYPHRDATGALTLARERGYHEIVAIIEEEEQRRRATLGGPMAIATPAPDELAEAIRAGDEARALAMLENEPALATACTRGGWTPLHAAAAMHNEALVAWLLQHGADANRRGPGSRTPLDQSVGRGWSKAADTDRCEAVARILRQHGADLTFRSAVAIGEADWLRDRHAAGRLENPIEDWGGLLTIAVRHDRPDVLALLLDFGLDPDERTRVEGLEEVMYSQGMPLWHCAVQGKHEMAEMLLGRGADPNAQVYASGSPVSSAYGRRDWKMIELLKRYGGAPGAITIGLQRQTELASQVLSGEADGRISDGMFAGRTTAEQLLWGAACGGSSEIVRMALERVDWPRHDPRWYAILEQPLRIWNHMDGHWANPTFDRDEYLTCFHLVLERSDANIRGRFGRTILHDVAAFRDHMKPEEAVAFATMLLDAGARLDVRDDLLRSTPLGWACRWGRIELVKLLLERGADPIEPGAEPWATPGTWAEKMGHAGVSAVLRKHGS